MPGVDLNEAGLCNDCVDFLNKQYLYGTSRAASFLNKQGTMEERFRAAKALLHPYDALVLLSGGKDSAYLSYWLKQQYDLHLLAIAVKHPLMVPLAVSNLQMVASKVGCDLIEYTIDEDLFRATVKAALEAREHLENGDRIGDIVCDYFYNVVACNMAIYFGIPLLLSGLDAEQCILPMCVVEGKRQHLQRRFAETEQLVTHLRGTASARSMYTLDLANLDKGDLPDMIYPFTFIRHDKKEELNALASLGISTQSMQKIRTNSDAVHFFDYFSYRSFGCETYRRHFAREIRMKGYCDFSGSFARRLTREELLVFLGEQRALVELAADKRVGEGFTAEELRAGFPHFLTVCGEANMDDVLARLNRIPYYARYFGMSLS